MEFLLLGPVEGRLGDRVVSLGVRRQRLVIAVLALEVNRMVPTARLADLSWPQDPPASARAMIHNQVSGLRQILRSVRRPGENVWVESAGPGYLLRCDPMSIDAHRFLALLDRARQAACDEDRWALLGHASALWRGPALAGVTADEVHGRLCQGIEEARLGCIEDRVAAGLRLGRDSELINELFGLVSENPHRPRLSAALMRVLHRAGRSEEALQVYQKIRHRLRDGLGLDPPEELRRIQEAILRNEPGRVRPAPVGAGRAVPR